MGARVVEGTGLENRRRLITVRGFESHLIRFVFSGRDFCYPSFRGLVTEE